MMTDPIADMLSRIRNALLAKKGEVRIPYSKIKWSIAEILEREGYLGHIEKLDESHGIIRVRLKYRDTSPAIQSLERVSKPGHRLYVKAGEIRPVLQGYGMAIISTPQGLKTDREARQAHLGGELICEIT